MPKDNLAATGAELAEAVRGLSHQYKRSRRWIITLGISLCFDLALTVGFAFVFANTQATAAQQRATTEKALCPLYQYILTAYHPELQKPEALPEYNKFHQLIVDGLQGLNCQS